MTFSGMLGIVKEYRANAFFIFSPNLFEFSPVEFELELESPPSASPVAAAISSGSSLRVILILKFRSHGEKIIVKKC